MEVQSLEG